MYKHTLVIALLATLTLNASAQQPDDGLNAEWRGDVAGSSYPMTGSSEALVKAACDNALRMGRKQLDFRLRYWTRLRSEAPEAALSKCQRCETADASTKEYQCVVTWSVAQARNTSLSAKASPQTAAR